MALEGTIYQLPNFVSAQSLMGLRRAMLKNNARKGYQFSYRDIQFVSGKWYAFYDEYLDAQRDDLFKELHQVKVTSKEDTE